MVSLRTNSAKFSGRCPAPTSWGLRACARCCSGALRTISVVSPTNDLALSDRRCCDLRGHHRPPFSVTFAVAAVAKLDIHRRARSTPVADGAHEVTDLRSLRARSSCSVTQPEIGFSKAPAAAPCAAEGPTG